MKWKPRPSKPEKNWFKTFCFFPGRCWNGCRMVIWLEILWKHKYWDRNECQYYTEYYCSDCKKRRGL